MILNRWDHRYRTDPPPNVLTGPATSRRRNVAGCFGVCLICSIPDDHVSPRRSALFMARSVLRFHGAIDEELADGAARAFRLVGRVEPRAEQQDERPRPASGARQYAGRTSPCTKRVPRTLGGIRAIDLSARRHVENEIKNIAPSRTVTPTRFIRPTNTRHCFPGRYAGQSYFPKYSEHVLPSSSGNSP
jgi:hypothetical protein